MRFGFYTNCMKKDLLEKLTTTGELQDFFGLISCFWRFLNEGEQLMAINFGINVFNITKASDIVEFIDRQDFSRQKKLEMYRDLANFFDVAPPIILLAYTDSPEQVKNAILPLINYAIDTGEKLFEKFTSFGHDADDDVHISIVNLRKQKIFRAIYLYPNLSNNDLELIKGGQKVLKAAIDNQIERLGFEKIISIVFWMMIAFIMLNDKSKAMTYAYCLEKMLIAREKNETANIINWANKLDTAEFEYTDFEKLIGSELSARYLLRHKEYFFKTD